MAFLRAQLLAAVTVLSADLIAEPVWAQTEIPAAAPRFLEPESVAARSWLLPAWGAVSAEAPMLAVGEAMMDALALAELVSLLTSSPKSAEGGGLANIIGLGLGAGVLVLNRVASVPLNRWLASRRVRGEAGDPASSGCRLALYFDGEASAQPQGWIGVEGGTEWLRAGLAFGSVARAEVEESAADDDYASFVDMVSLRGNVDLELPVHRFARLFGGAQAVGGRPSRSTGLRGSADQKVEHLAPAWSLRPEIGLEWMGFSWLSFTLRTGMVAWSSHAVAGRARSWFVDVGARLRFFTMP